jgi:hypothetical protein
MGAQRIEFVPGELVAGGEPQRGIGSIPPLEYQAGVTSGGGLGGADAGPGG